MRSFRSTIITLLALYALLSLYTIDTASGHSAAAPWLQELRNGENSKCCGEDDCIPVESVEVLETNGATMQILINGNAIAQIHRMSLVPIACDKRPHVCLQKSIGQEGKIIPCWWINNDGSLGIFPSPQCYRCVLAQKCPASS